ncbi:MAG: hypothetical protein ACE10E_09240 [Acidiferrobacterales bacterium]
MRLLIVAVGYPLAVHAAVMLKHPVAGFGALLAVILIHLTVKQWGNNQHNLRAVRGTLLGIFVLTALLAIALRWGPTYALFLPPIAINVFLLIVFGRTLLPGCEPIIARLSRVLRGNLPGELRTYTRCLTWVWTGVFAGLAVESVLLAVYAPLEVWSLFTNILNYVLLAVLFVAEYIYRVRRFRKYTHTSPLQLVVELARRGVSPLLRS